MHSDGKILTPFEKGFKVMYISLICPSDLFLFRINF